MDYPKEWNELPRHERRRKLKQLKRERSHKRIVLNRGLIWVAVLVVGTLLVGTGYSRWKNREILPPTDIAGHIESSPEAHIMDRPMPDAVQKHMLEHADGSGPPGVVINYNCEDFGCEPDLLENLRGVVDEYPEFVYLAPYPGMTKKIAITKIGKIETFDSFNRDAFLRFIEEK